MNLDRNRRKRGEEDTNLKKRRFSEFDRKGKHGNANNSFAQEKQFSFKSPENSEIQTHISRTQSYVYNSEQRIESQMPTMMETEVSRPIEKFSGISTLFSNLSNQNTSEKKSREEGNYLSSLLQSSYKKKASPPNQSDKSNSYKKLHL